MHENKLYKTSNIVYEKISSRSLEETIEVLKSNLKKDGFGVLWELDFKDKLNESNLVLKDSYVVLEVCNPKLAKDLLDENIEIGYMLPCKMVVRNQDNKTYIGMTHPEVLYGMFSSKKTNETIKLVVKSLKKAIKSTI